MTSTTRTARCGPACRVVWEGNGQDFWPSPIPIKQHLRIKAFYGNSENAVKTQIWTAISAYVLIALVKKRMNLDITLYTFLQILSVSVFEKVDILQLVKNSAGPAQETNTCNQLNLFDL